MSYLRKHQELIEVLDTTISSCTINDGDKLEVIDPTDEELQRIVVGLEELGYDIDGILELTGKDISDYHTMYPACEGLVDYFKDGNTIGGKLVQILIAMVHKALGLLKIDIKTKKGKYFGAVIPDDLIKRYNRTIQHWQDTYIVKNLNTFTKDADKQQALGYKNFVLFDYTINDNKLNPSYHAHDRMSKLFDYLNPSASHGRIIEDDVIEVFTTHPKLSKYEASRIYFVLPEDNSIADEMLAILSTIKSTSILADLMQRRNLLEDYSEFSDLAKKYSVNILDTRYNYLEAATNLAVVREENLNDINNRLDLVAKSKPIDHVELNSILEDLILYSNKLYSSCDELVRFYNTPEGEQHRPHSLIERLSNTQERVLFKRPSDVPIGSDEKRRVAETLILDSLTTELTPPNKKSIKKRKQAGKVINELSEEIALTIEAFADLYKKAEDIRPLTAYAKGNILKTQLVNWGKLTERSRPVLDANVDTENQFTSLGVIVSMLTNLLKDSTVIYSLATDSNVEEIYSFDVAHFADMVKTHKRNVETLMKRT